MKVIPRPAAPTFTYETSDGTTTGEVFVAEGGEVEFTANEDVLIGEETFDDVTIRLVLSKTNQ